MYHLIVSNPPHRLDSLDATACAACFECSASEVRVKANSPAPEIWYGDTNQELISKKVSILCTAGLNVFSISGNDLAQVPPPAQADAFSFSDNAVIFDISQTPLDLVYPQKLFVVSCRPKLPVGNFSPDAFLGALKRGLQTGHKLAMARRYGGMTGTIKSVSIHMQAEARRTADKMKQTEKDAAVRKANPPYLAFMDIYFGCEGGHGRVTVVEGTLNYQPLGANMKTTARENSKVLLETIVKLYGEVHVDTRLENWHYKPSTIAGLNLNKLLELTDPSLKDLDPYDLASRVAFIAARPEHRPQALPPETCEKPSDPAPEANAPRRNMRREFE